MGTARSTCPGWLAWLLLAWLATPLALAAVTFLEIEVTVPPFIVSEAPSHERLFNVQHDPDVEPEPLVLSCQAEGLPPPSYTWLRDGEPYNWDEEKDEEEEARVEMVEGEGTLVFHNPQPEDEGVYQCIAENSVGVAHSDLITVRRTIMGRFPKSKPKVVTASLGQSLGLPCDPPKGYPEPTPHWILQTSNGDLRSLNDPRLTVDEEGTLWFSYVAPEDASEDALYACAVSHATSGQQLYVVKYEDGALEVVEEPIDSGEEGYNLPTEYRMGNWVYLNVSDADEDTTMPETPQPPVAQYVSPKETTVLKGDEVKLYCLHGGYPVPEVRWWRESRADTEEDGLKGDGKVLVLDDVDMEDSGTYFCQAQNDAGESPAQTFTVYVEAEPTFTIEPEVVNLSEGDTATLSCEAEGDPAPIISWTKDGEPLDTHETTLVFDGLKFTDKAVFACNASNAHGYVYKSVYINVLSLPPEWKTEPQDVYVLEGGAAELECEAFGSPDPEITWARVDGDEKVILHDEDPRYTITNDKLVINRVDETTDGIYVCTAINKFASIDSEAEVAVRGMTQVRASLEDDRVEAGDHVTLNCRISIDAELEPTITWFKDDVEVDLDDDNFHTGRRAFTDDDDEDDNDKSSKRLVETWALEILEVHGHDSGVYTCRVHTDLDDSSDDLILTVEDVPNPPSVSDVRCEPRVAYLEWSSSGDNNAPLQGFVIQYKTRLHPDWQDAENQIPSSGKSFSVEMSPGLNYTFRVLAFNRVGMSEPSEETVECSAPGLPPDHNPFNVTLGGDQPGTLTISWDAMPPQEQNGPDFHYKVSWRVISDEYDEDDYDDDSTGNETVAEDDDETVAEEDEEEDEWHTMIIEDWEQNEVELKDLPPYQAYEVKVEALNHYGDAPEDTRVEEGFSGEDEPEEAPEDFTVADADATDVVLSWTPVDEDSLNGPLQGYKIEYWEGDNEEDTELHLTTGPSHRAELTGLQPFTTYHARVSAANSAYNGPHSEVVEFTTAEGDAGPVEELMVRPMGTQGLLVHWEAPQDPQGVVLGYQVMYHTVNEDGEEGEAQEYDEDIPASTNMIKLSELEEGANYVVSVAAVNGAGDGEWSSGKVNMDDVISMKPAVPVFSWSFIKEEDDYMDKDGDGDVDDDDIRYQNTIIGDTDGDGDVDVNDVLDTDGDGDVDQEDIDVADIDNDGDVDEDDVKAADRDGDGDVDIGDIGDEDGDGDFDGDDVIAADEDGDGDIDASDDDEENVLLEDRDQDGDIDEDDVVDINNDGIIDEEDISAADVDNDGDVDEDDLKAGDKDGDGDIDAADITDLDGDGQVDGDDLEVTDRDGDGDVDARDYKLKSVFLTDVDGDGDIDIDDVMDTDNDGDIDQHDIDVADIDNDGDVDEDDVKAADRDGDGDIDAADIGDEDNDGDIDGHDVIKADEDGDGDIDASDDDEEHVLLEDRDGDGDIDASDVGDLDGDGDVDLEDFEAADIDDDGDVDEDDVKMADKDGDGDVDAADLLDLDGDGKVDGDDLEFEDRDGDGDIDAKDISFQHTLLADTDGDGDVDADDVLDVDGDGDIDEVDRKAADIDDDGDVDADDVAHADRDGDGDVDDEDVQDLDGDGFIDEDDLDVKDRDGDGDIDAKDFRLRNVILADTDGDGDVDKHDVLDTDGDGDVDEEDFNVADINNDGKVDRKDIRAADRDHDGDIDIADIGDEDGDGDVDGDDVEAADEDGDGDIDSSDFDGEDVLLHDANRDGKIDSDDVTDIDGDGDVDDDDVAAADVDNDGDVDEDDLMAADRDGDGDIDAADIVDVDGDGDVDAHDLIAMDKDGDGDVDASDVENLDVFLKDTDGDGDVDIDDVLDTDHDGDIDEEDIAVADINNDGQVNQDDVIAADQDGDGDVDFRDIGDEDGDGNIDGDDVVLADRDGDGDIDAADDGRGVDVVINWKPDFDEHPGVDFNVESRVQGASQWVSAPVERRHLYQTLHNLDPRRAYEVRVAAHDEKFTTFSDVALIEPSEEMEQAEEPTVGAVMEDNPILWTWFVIAVMASVTMICIVFFSMWVYSHRMSRVAELRASLYDGYEPPEPEPLKKEVDLEAAKEEVLEDEMTANFQRKQLSAMLRRQETVQSVDSFASHDDDFAEYGDESMAIDLLSSVSLVTNPRHQRPPPAPRT